MKKITTIILTIFLLLISLPAFSADDGAEPIPLEGLERIEKVVYGSPRVGGLLPRLAKIESDLFGMELPGSLSERQQALFTFVEKGNVSQPSLLFKIDVAEWVILRCVYPAQPLGERISNLETTLEDSAKEGALSARLERIITKILPGGVVASKINVPAATMFKTKFASTITVKTVKAGDPIWLELAEDCLVNGTLVAARGNRLFAEVSKVKPPRSFGRSSEIAIEFHQVETIGGEMVPVTVGEASKRASKIDSGAIGAAGASLAGVVLLGPVGLAGGFLVRGNDRQIPEGTIAYVEAANAIEIDGYEPFGIERPNEKDAVSEDIAASGATVQNNQVVQQQPTPTPTPSSAVPAPVSKDEPKSNVVVY